MLKQVRKVKLQTLQISRKVHVTQPTHTMSHNFPVLLDKLNNGLVHMLELLRAAPQKTIICSFGCTRPLRLMLLSLYG